jgi:hypothetical protein
MPANLFGLPTHILLIHAVVVLLPLAALLTVLAVLWPAFRHRYGLAVLVFTFLTTLTVPVAAQSGESLLSRLPETAARLHHATLGQQLEIWTAVFGLALFAMLAVDLYRRAAFPPDELSVAERWMVDHVVPDTWRAEHAATGGAAKGAFVVTGALALILAVAVGVMVFRAGDSGARAVWSTYPQLAATAGDSG